MSELMKYVPERNVMVKREKAWMLSYSPGTTSKLGESGGRLTTLFTPLFGQETLHFVSVDWTLAFVLTGPPMVTLFCWLMVPEVVRLPLIDEPERKKLRLPMPLTPENAFPRGPNSRVFVPRLATRLGLATFASVDRSSMVTRLVD